jgi:hypothetical protein
MWELAVFYLQQLPAFGLVGSVSLRLAPGWSRGYGETTSSRTPASGSGGHGTEGDAKKPRKRKRRVKGQGNKKNNENGSGNDDHDSSGDDPAPPSADGLKRTFACPFFRYNPLRYLSCMSHTLANYDAVRKHLRRKHMGTEFYCPICFTFFDDATSRDYHITNNSTQPCTPRTGRDEITKADWQAAERAEPSERCPRTSNSLEKCAWLWRFFFRGCPPISRERLFLDDPIAEAKGIFIDLPTIRSTLGASTELYGQNEREEAATLMHDALMRANSSPGMEYRVHIHTDAGRRLTGEQVDQQSRGALVDPGNRLGFGPTPAPTAPPAPTPNTPDFAYPAPEAGPSQPVLPKYLQETPCGDEVAVSFGEGTVRSPLTRLFDEIPGLEEYDPQFANSIDPFLERDLTTLNDRDPPDLEDAGVERDWGAGGS